MVLEPQFDDDDLGRGRLILPGLFRGAQAKRRRAPFC